MNEREKQKARLVAALWLCYNAAVAFTPAHPLVSPEPGEVIEIIETPLELIVDQINVIEEEWEIRGYKAIVPFFRVNGHRVWGATAMMLGEWAEMLRNVQRET